MLGRFLSHLSYANVVSTICLVVVLSGTAYAATILPTNSVGSAQLKANAVTSDKVRDGALLRKDFKAGQLLAGPRGSVGAPGAQGPAGPPGPKGDTGTPDTSNFYDKTASDSRFLGLHATADDSTKLGGIPAASYVSSEHGGTIFQDVRTITPTTVELVPLPGHPLWALHLVCSAPPSGPPTSDVGVRNGSGETLDLFAAINGGTPFHAVVPPGPGVMFFASGLVTLHGAFANGDTLNVTVANYATTTDCHFITQGMIAKST